MGRAAEAGTRYLSSVEKAMRRMSDKSSIESRNALSDAKREAETSLSLIEDALFAEAGIAGVKAKYLYAFIFINKTTHII